MNLLIAPPRPVNAPGTAYLRTDDVPELHQIRILVHAMDADYVWRRVRRLPCVSTCDLVPDENDDQMQVIRVTATWDEVQFNAYLVAVLGSYGWEAVWEVNHARQS